MKDRLDASLFIMYKIMDQVVHSLRPCIQAFVNQLPKGLLRFFIILIEHKHSSHVLNVVCRLKLRNACSEHQPEKVYEQRAMLSDDDKCVHTDLFELLELW